MTYPGPILDEGNIKADLDRRFERLQVQHPESELRRDAHHITLLILALTDCARHVRPGQVGPTTRGAPLHKSHSTQPTDPT